MSDKTQPSLEYGFELIRQRLFTEQQNIGSELEKRTVSTTVKIAKSAQRYGSRGRKTSKNDYLDYFWINVSYVTSPIGSPNKKDCAGHWYLCSENAGNPCLKIDENGYSAEKVVSYFLNFLENNGEQNIRKPL